MTARPLLRALHGTASPPLRPLPSPVAELLQRLDCPPRLAAHLRAVHDVACQLADWAGDRSPPLAFDRDAVLFGAASHDIGKVVHVAELSGPGSAHEETGRRLLLDHGVSPELARFAATHASWTRADAGIEDLMVSVADKIWKNKRVPELEDLLIVRLAASSGREPWEEFAALDEFLSRIGDGAGDGWPSRPCSRYTHSRRARRSAERAGRRFRCPLSTAGTRSDRSRSAPGACPGHGHILRVGLRCGYVAVGASRCWCPGAVNQPARVVRP